jgi:hypothetical protein
VWVCRESSLPVYLCWVCQLIPEFGCCDQSYSKRGYAGILIHWFMPRSGMAGSVKYIHF